MVIREVFPMKPKRQYHLSQRGECVYDAQSWKKGGYYVNPCLSQLKDNFNSKNGSKRSFLIKLKHQYHWSQQGECVYDGQSWKGRWLLCESMFITIERRTSILKMVIIKVFLIKLKQQYL